MRLAFLPWIVAYWAALATICFATALKLRSTRAALATTLLGSSGFMVIVSQARLWPGGEVLRHWLVPPVVVDEPVTYFEIAGSTLLYAALSAVVAALLVLRLRAWAARR